MDINEIRDSKEYPAASWEMEVAVMPDKEWFMLSPPKQGKRKEIGRPCGNKNNKSSKIIKLSYYRQQACDYQWDWPHLLLKFSYFIIGFVCFSYVSHIVSHEVSHRIQSNVNHQIFPCDFITLSGSLHNHSRPMMSYFSDIIWHHYHAILHHYDAIAHYTVLAHGLLIHSLWIDYALYGIIPLQGQTVLYL